MPSQSQSFDKRRLVGILPERITNVSNTEFPGHDPKIDHSWNLTKFKKVRSSCLPLFNSVFFFFCGID